MTVIFRSRAVPRLCVAALVAVALSACGSTKPVTPAPSAAQQLKAFQLAEAGSAHAKGGRTWQQYGARPVDSPLTINPMTLYNAGTTPLVLLDVRQARPVAGLRFTAEMVTLTPGFSAYSEYVNRGVPADAFSAHANFSPLRGYVMDPNPKATMGAISPTVVLTATAQRPGIFHIGDWVVSYRVDGTRHSVTLVDDGVFCAGAKGCPSL
jgi:hypothetical protein